MKFKKLILTTLLVSPIYSTIAQNNDSELDSIVVSAKAPVSENEFAGSASSMTSEDIERLGISSVSEAIETLPGVQLVVSGGSSTKVPQVRGFDSDQVLVLINGKRIANTDRNIPFSPGYRYDWIPIANIEKIEILKGSTSSLYGADAMGGVINIITKTPNKDFSFNLNAGAERLDSDVSGGNTNQIGASFSGFISDNVDYLIAAEKTDTDALVSEDGSTAVSGRDRANLQLDLGIDVNDTSRASISLIDSQEELIDGDISAFTGQLSTTTTDISRNSIGINYETVFGNYDSNFGISSSKAEQDGSSQWNVEENTITADFQGQLSLNQYLSFGILHRNEGVDRNDSVVFSDETDATMAYVQDVISLNPKNNLTLGLAVDSHSKYGTEPSPKIYFNHKFSDAIGFKIGAGRSYLAPALRESSSAYRVPAGPTRVYIGNDDLQPETSTTFETGMTFSSENNTGHVMFFNSSIDDLITIGETTSSAGVTTAEYENLEEATIRGIETEWKHTLASINADVAVNYTYLDTENKSGENAGNQLSNRADHNLKLIYNQSFASGFSFRSSLRYLGEQFINDDNSDSIDPYSVIDLSLAKQFDNGLRLSLAANNITDKVIEDGGEFIEKGRSFQVNLGVQY